MPVPDYTRLDLPAPPPDRPYVLTNMVMSADGKVVIEGTEQGIGSRTDQQLMRQLRVNADVVLNGAETLRRSGSSPRVGSPELQAIRIAAGKSPNPIGAVISRSGDLPLERLFFTATDFETVVYLSATAPAARRTAIAATGRLVVDLPPGEEVSGMLRHMRQQLGGRVLLVEGGPETNRHLFDGGFVDEYFLTLGPVVVGGRAMLSAVGGAAPYAKESTRHLQLLAAIPNDDTGEVYCRYRVLH